MFLCPFCTPDTFLESAALERHGDSFFIHYQLIYITYLVFRVS